jgi:hypothetical protein
MGIQVICATAAGAMRIFQIKTKTFLFVLLLSPVSSLYLSGATTIPAVRVALMDLAVDDNSYRSAQAAANFTSLLQIELANEPGLKWVERAQLDLAKQELRLSEMELLSGAADIRRGKWVKAEWLITGRFSLDDQSRRILFLEITDLHHADVLASENVTLSGMAGSPMKVGTDQIPNVVSALRHMVLQARERAANAAGKIIVAPLFFVNLREFGRAEDFEPLKFGFQNTLDKMAKTNTHFHLIRFPKAFLARDEIEMLMDGLAESDTQSWESPADLFVWGNYSAVSSFTFVLSNSVSTRQERTRHMLSVEIWDGLAPPVTVDIEQTASNFDALPAKEAQPLWERLAKTLQQPTAKQNGGKSTTSIRRDLAAALLNTFVRAGGRSSQPNPSDPSAFLENIRLIETACFFDPKNQEAQALRISSRWGAWVDRSNVKNQFLSKWRRSNAWGKYVEQFGLGPPQGPLPLTDYRSGVAEIYLRSLAEVIQMFPGEGGFGLPQSRGFPADMPLEYVAQWKAQLMAELAERKRRVEANKGTLAEANPVAKGAAAIAAPPAAAPSDKFTGSIAHASALTAQRPTNQNRASPEKSTSARVPAYVPQVVTNKMRGTPTASAKQSPVTPPGSEAASARPTFGKHLGQSSNLFELYPPSLWPVEVTPSITELRFPAHFETKTILKILSWRDQLVTLVLDERSAPSSDPNPDIIAELLTKAGRLWVLSPGKTNPVLLQAEGLPETIHSFLIENDRLWIAEKVVGYVDLTKRNFYIRKGGDAVAVPEDHALAAGAGRLYALRHSGISSFEPVSSDWTELTRPGRWLEGQGIQSSLAANERWLCCASSGAHCFNFARGFWTNIPDVSMIRCASADPSGFWLGGRSGLHFYEPETGRAQHWAPPMYFEGLWNVSRPPNLKLLAQAPGELSSGFDHLANSVKKTQAEARKYAFVPYPKTKRDPLQLSSHIAGQVIAFAHEGENLWIAIADRVLLLNLPTRSLVACCQCRGKPLACLGVSDEAVWAGLAFGEQLLLRIPKRDFYNVPKDQWMPLAITPEERQRLIAGMSIRDQAIYAFYAGDPDRVIKFLEGLNKTPEVATPEQMLLLAVTYDADALDDPQAVRAWCDRIILQYPNSQWATFARKEIEESEQDHVYRQHGKDLARVGQRQSVVPATTERRAIEKSPQLKREEKALAEDLLGPQIQALIRKYDYDKDGKLGRIELDYVKKQVNVFVNLGPENFPKNNIYVAPLLTRHFPTIDALLKKYDLNKDGSLDAAELIAFARDLRNER